jgi:hypothetical protein
MRVVSDGRRNEAADHATAAPVLSEEDPLPMVIATEGCLADRGILFVRHWEQRGYLGGPATLDLPAGPRKAGQGTQWTLNVIWNAECARRLLTNLVDNGLVLRGQLVFA